jgi:catechol 2,3-dioxygenase
MTEVAKGELARDDANASRAASGNGGRCRDIAHLGAIELYSPSVEDTVAFFVGCLGLSEVARQGSSVYLRTWDDYQQFSLKVTDHATAGVGRTWLRASSPDALARRVDAVSAAGLGEQWTGGEIGTGPTFICRTPDGHELGLYYESEWYQAPEGERPALKNQAARFPGRGANVRRVDHINYLAADAPANGAFVCDELGGTLTEQIVLDSGEASGIWYTFSDKSYDMVFTADWAGASSRLHHIAFATDTREDILRAADVCLEAGIFIECGPHKHAIQQTFFLYVWEPAGNRIELCNAGARLLLAPDWRPISWSQAERAKGQAWGLKTIETFHTHGTPPLEPA